METKQTNDCLSGLYSDLTSSNLAQVRQEKLLVFLRAKQELDQVDTEVRLRQWRTGLIERGVNQQRQYEMQRLEAEAVGLFKKNNDGQVVGAPRGAFGKKGNNSKRKSSILSDTNEAAVLEMLASLG